MGNGAHILFSGCSIAASSASFPPYFLIIVVGLKASKPPHKLNLLLEVSKGMLPGKYFCSNKAFVSAEFCGDHKTVIMLR